MPTRRWLVRFGYDGRGFAGWARQPGRRTIEGEIRRGLVRCGLSPSAERARLEVASRTDAGVSARGNALTLTSSSLPGAALLRALNGISPEIFFTHATEVADEFRVRRPERRTYRYLLPQTEPLSPGLTKWAARFVPRIDARNFGRGVSGNVPQFRPIESATLLPEGAGWVFEVTAPGFVWGMVRKMVASLIAVAEGTFDTETLDAAIEGRRRLTLPLAPPDALALWEVEYSLPWSLRHDRSTRAQAAHRSDLLRSAAVASWIGTDLWPGTLAATPTRESGPSFPDG